MTSRSTRLLTSVTAALALLSLPLLGSPAEAVDRAAAERAAAKPGKSVTVMTRNLYLGADIMRPIREVQAVDPEPAATYPFRQIDALAKGTRETWDVVRATNFRTRAKLLASELVEHKPDLVGLQEVALWRKGPMDDPAGPNLLVPNAEKVKLDFLALLRKELRA